MGAAENTQYDAVNARCEDHMNATMQGRMTNHLLKLLQRPNC